MDLTPHIDHLRRELATAADVGGAEVRAAAESLTAALESAVRLTLLEVLADAADAVTTQIQPGVVELRIRSREPEFVFTPPYHGVQETHDQAWSDPWSPPQPPLPPEPPATPTRARPG